MTNHDTMLGSPLPLIFVVFWVPLYHSFPKQEFIVKIHQKWMGLAISLCLLLLILAACTTSDSAQDASLETAGVENTQAVEETSATSEAGQLEFTPSSEVSSAEPFSLEGALTTESGLQYLELSGGDGRTPEDGDLVTMHFSGSLPDGTVFTDSREVDKPITVVFGREQLLPGWEEGVGMMKAGGRARLLLPPDLAFGEEGYGNIPPNTPVILEVDLLAVEKPPQPTTVKEADLANTEKGVQFYDITEGEGDQAVSNSIVTTNFTIWVQGEATHDFVVSSEQSEPITFVVGQGKAVFPGWEEGVLSMKVGGKRLLIIPPDLAFGANGAGSIPPDATIVMEIELVNLREPLEITEVDEADYITTESGLKYYDIAEGEGEMPAEGQTVVVDYAGWLEDGTLFDSSLERGEPFSLRLGVGDVIPGWDEGVATMKVGGKRQLVIPPDLAYGETGAGGVIPPGATLIFEVELLEIQP